MFIKKLIFKKNFFKMSKNTSLDSFVKKTPIKRKDNIEDNKEFTSKSPKVLK